MPNGGPHWPPKQSRLRRTRRHLAGARRSARRLKWAALLIGVPLLLLLWLYYDEFGLPTKVSNIISDGHDAIEQGQNTGEREAARATAAAEREAARATADAEHEAARATAVAQHEADHLAKVREIEQHIHLGINAQREAHGGSPLRYVDPLATVARAHSADMISRGYFDHDTPEGLDPSDRVSRSGYNCYAGENIAIEYDSSATTVARKAVEGWMNSPGHRTNILDGQYDRTGVGASLGRYHGYSAWYLTQLFCLR